MTPYPSGSRLSAASATRTDVTGTEDVTMWTGRTTPTEGAVPVVYCHGLLGTGVDPTWRDQTKAADDFRPIAAWGHPVIVANLAGAATWGNQASVDAIGHILAWAAQAHGTRTDKVVLAAESMGALTALNWAARYPDRVAALWLRVPCLGLEWTRNNVAAFTASIDAAYGGSVSQSEYDTYDPMRNTTVLRTLRDRARVWATAADEFFPLATTTAFAGQLGFPIDVIGGAHAAGYDTPPYTVAEWLDRTIRTTSVPSRLEAIGADIDQTAAHTEEARWLTLIRQAGSGSPPSNFNYLGGDVTDGFRTDGNDIVWAGADWWDGTTVDADDTYAGAALPIRNGALIETTDGTFAQQLYRSGGSGVWLDAPADGGLAAGTLWWPICGLNDGGTSRVLCWHVNGAATTPYGTLLDSHIVTINAFGTYGSHVATNLGASDRFWIDGVLRDTTHTYIFGEQFRPDYDADTTGNGSVPNYGTGDLTQSFTLKRVARVANGSLTTVASWQFWNGNSWVSGVANADPLRDDTGREIRGDAGVAKIATGHYLLAAHRLVDTHLDVYRSTAPQGPWTPIARVPVPTQGLAIGGGTQVGQLTKILAFTPPAVPAGHSMAMISRNVLAPTDSFADRNIRRYAPQFVVIPHT